MDIELIERLMRLLEDSNLDQLEVEQKGLRVRLQKQNQPSVVTPVTSPAPAQLSPSAGSVSSESALPPGTVTIDAPMVGTFYRAAASDAQSYVEIGSPITEQTVVCIVEAMKVMNEIKAGVHGTIVDTLADNAQPVEYGQPLFLVKPTSV